MDPERRDVFSEIRDGLARAKGTLEEERERKLAEEQTKMAAAVNEVSDMVEGNIRLQQQQSAEGKEWHPGPQSEYVIKGGIGWGYRDVELKKEMELHNLRAQIEQEEKTIPRIQEDIASLEAELERENLSPDLLQQPKEVLQKAKEDLEAKKRRLPELTQEYQNMQSDFERFQGEQDEIAKDNIAFSVETVLGQHREAGQDLRIAPDELAKGVKDELTRREEERRKAREEKEDQSLLQKHRETFAEVIAELSRAKEQALLEFSEIEKNLSGAALLAEVKRRKESIEAKLKPRIFGKPKYRKAFEDLEWLKQKRQELFSSIITAENNVRSFWVQIEHGYDQSKPNLAKFQYLWEYHSEKLRIQIQKEAASLLKKVHALRDEMFAKSNELKVLLDNNVLSYEEEREYHQRGIPQF